MALDFLKTQEEADDTIERIFLHSAVKTVRYDLAVRAGVRLGQRAEWYDLQALGHAYFQRERYSESFIAYEKAYWLRPNPELAQALIGLGNAKVRRAFFMAGRRIV